MRRVVLAREIGKGAVLVLSPRRVAAQRAGEEAVLSHMPQAYIFRPSVVFGPEDQFFNRFASMAQTGPILPFAGAATRFQPVYVDDIAQAVEIALTRETPAGTYELGGPEIIDFAGLMRRMLSVIERRRLLVNIPFFMARPMAAGFDFLETVTLRLFKNGILTRDQLKDLTVDNVVSETAKGFRYEFGYAEEQGNNIQEYEQQAKQSFQQSMRLWNQFKRNNPKATATEMQNEFQRIVDAEWTKLDQVLGIELKNTIIALEGDNIDLAFPRLTNGAVDTGTVIQTLTDYIQSTDTTYLATSLAQLRYLVDMIGQR